ncbi:hypothetical protein TELCIR_22891 [Teladorsagia circumcincta]|uniref:Uncharacterized protein n=1 Tax=Teladorsagia circumcincta TaxID=45464 RepID=A0A2G9TCM5_TELCI|nr:hypothetical protein TELCIR_22891 [Teladorsagia circumcincta]
MLGFPTEEQTELEISISKRCSVRDEDNLVPHEDGSMREVDEVRWFVYRKLHYIWVEKVKKIVDIDDERDGHWVTPGDVISQAPSHVFHDAIKRGTGFDEHEVSST